MKQRESIALIDIFSAGSFSLATRYTADDDDSFITLGALC
jgi:hypothetical protein